MPEKYWLLENVYIKEDEEYYNTVIAIDQHESVIRSRMQDRIELLRNAGYMLYADEDSAVLTDDIFEVKLYILKEVTHFPK